MSAVKSGARIVNLASAGHYRAKGMTGDGKTFRLLATWPDEARARAEPFDAIALQLDFLWAR